jgi:hypothetical protein
MKKLGRFSKHLGQGEALVIGEDIFYIKPLPIAKLDLFYKFMRDFASMKKNLDKMGVDSGKEMKTEDFMSVLDDNIINTIKELIKATLEVSFPEESVSEREEFGMKYSMQMLDCIMRVNTPQGNTNKMEEFIKARTDESGNSK